MKIKDSAMKITPSGTLTSTQSRQSLGAYQGKQEEAPRAGNLYSASPGVMTKENIRYKLPAATTYAKGTQRHITSRRLEKLTYRDKCKEIKNPPRYWRGEEDNWDPPITPNDEDAETENVILLGIDGNTYSGITHMDGLAALTRDSVEKLTPWTQ